MLAELVLDTIISRAIKKLPFPVPIIRKYVDDLFLAIPQESCEQVLQIFNEQEQRLQFTMEREHENRLPYLDMVVVRNDHQMLKTEWYIKPIASGRMLNWFSCHQLKHKLNVANNLINRIALLSRNEENQNIYHVIHQLLKQNNYPKKLINRLINTNRNIQSRKSHQQNHKPHADQPSNNIKQQLSPHHSSTDHLNQSSSQSPNHLNQLNPSINHPTPDQAVIQSATQQNILTADQQNIVTAAQQNIITIDQQKIHPSNSSTASSAEQVYRSVPYIPLLTERLIHCLSMDYPNVKIASRKNMTVGDMHSRVKDPKRIGEKSNVVYQIPCEEPCSSVYIGLTKNTLDQRLSGHKSNIKMLKKKQDSITNNTRAAEKNREKDNTALIDHIIETNHTFNIDKTIVLDTSFNKYTLNFLEMCHIFNTPNTVNQRTDVNNLNSIFASVLNILNQHNYKKIYRKDVKNIDNQTEQKTTQEETLQNNSTA